MENSIVELYFRTFILGTTYFLESIGAIVILASAIHSFIQFAQRFFSKDDIKIRIVFASRLTLALEFKVGAEILRTVLVRSWQELGHLAAIIILRAVLNYILHLEMNHGDRLKMGNPFVPQWWDNIKGLDKKKE